MTTVERLCNVLECVLLNGPITEPDLRKSLKVDRWLLSGDLNALQLCGFVEYDALDVTPRVEVGERLRLIVDNVRAKP